MWDLWINEEKLTDLFLKETGHHMKVNGNIKSLYYIGEFTEGNPVEINKTYLKEFLKTQNTFPLYFSFSFFTDDVEDFVSGLAEHNIPYTLDFLEEKRTYYNINGKHHYHPPCFSVKVSDARLLEIVLDQTYWLAASNEFYSISYTDNLSFQLEEVVEWRRKGKRSVAVFHADEHTTIITVSHDGHGFYIYSNQQKYESVENLCQTLPKGSVIKQINETLINLTDLDNR